MTIQWFGLAYAGALLVQGAGALALCWAGLRARRSDAMAGGALLAAGLTELAFLLTCFARVEGSAASWGSPEGVARLWLLNVLALTAPLEHALVAGCCAIAVVRLVRREVKAR